MPPRARLAHRLPLEGTGSMSWWTGQLDWSASARKDRMPVWQQSVKSYLGERKGRPDDVRVNIEYEKTEQKRSQLLFAVPRVILRPKPSHQPANPDAVSVFQAVLNQEIGEDGINLKPVLDEIIFDRLCPAGIGAVCVGFEALAEGDTEIQVGEQPDPTFQMPGAVLNIGITPPMVPVMESAPNIVEERYFVDRISPAKLLIPPDFDGSDYDKAAWLGYDFWISEAEVVRKGWVTESHERSGEDDLRLVDLPSGGSRRGQIKGREVWYYADRV